MVSKLEATRAIAYFVEYAPDTPETEKALREGLSRVMMSVPKDLLKQVGRLIYQYSTREMSDGNTRTS